MTLEELEKTQEYQRLTPKQKLFISTYCAGGLVDGNYDSVAATQTAYQCRTPEVARIMSYSLMSNIRIIAVLNRHFKAEPIEEFLAMLDRAINNKKVTMAQILALKMKCEILGYTNKLPSHTDRVLPAIVAAQERERTARKAKRKPRAVKPEGPSEFDQQMSQL